MPRKNRLRYSPVPTVYPLAISPAPTVHPEEQSPSLCLQYQWSPAESVCAPSVLEPAPSEACILSQHEAASPPFVGSASVRSDYARISHGVGDSPYEGSVASPLPPSPQAPSLLHIHSDLYYLEDGNVIFQVQNELYRVHTYFFKTQSPHVFGQMFSNLSVTDPGRGSIDSHPIRLDDVSPYEFEALLEFMYSAIFTGGPSSFESWAAILHVSNMWQFDAIKAQAIKRINALEGLSPVDKIILAEKADVEEWLLPTYISLVERYEPISTHEARKLISLGEKQVGQVIGLDIPALLAQARERHHKAPRKFSASSASSVVDELFGPP